MTIFVVAYLFQPEISLNLVSLFKTKKFLLSFSSVKLKYLHKKHGKKMTQPNIPEVSGVSSALHTREGKYITEM